VLTIEDFARFAMAEIAVEKGDGGAFLGKEACAKLSELQLRDGGREEGGVFFGGQGTYTAAFAVWPSKGFGVVVCTNGGDGDEACASAVDAVRAACAPEIAAVPRPVMAGGPGRRLGIQMRAAPGDSLVITKVDPGSLAEKGGLRPRTRSSRSKGSRSRSGSRRRSRPRSGSRRRRSRCGGRGRRWSS
jgi:hypothetical protein